MIISLIFIAIISYLIGSIPFALILSKIFAGYDIRQEGSKNIGARNSYEVTGKKWIGLSVLLLDMSKGLLPAFLSKFLNGSIDCALFALLFAVIGHNFSAFIKFKGGRGLSTAFGGFLYIAPLVPVIWLLLYLIARIIKDDVHFKSAFATTLVPLILFIRSDKIFSEYNFQGLFALKYYPYISILICLVILLKHIEPIKNQILKINQK